MTNRHPLREGIVAGALGATAIAGWTLAVDAITDRIGVTAALIGAWIYQALGGEFGGRGFGVHVATWIVALYVGVIAIGIVASYLYSAADKRPSLWSGFAGFVIIFELILLSLTSFASESSLFGSWAWLHGLIGNVLGAVVMGRFLWRQRHPDNTWNWEREHERQLKGAPAQGK